MGDTVKAYCLTPNLMRTSFRRWLGLALAIAAVVSGLLLQLSGFPLVSLQTSAGSVVYSVSLVLVALVILSLVGVVLLAWPGREDKED